MTTTIPPREHLLHGDPTAVMGDVALLRAHGALRDVSEPRPVPGRPGQIAIKVWVDPSIAVPTAGPSAAVAVRRPPAPARVAPLRHPAAKPGWSVKRKLAVAGGVVLTITFLLGLLASWLLSIDLAQMATTAVGFVVVVLALAAMVRKASGHSAVCAGLHCPGCGGH